MPNDVIFIRRNGKVIPIKKTDGNYKKIMKESAVKELAAGGVTALGGGLLARYYRKTALKKYIRGEKAFRIKEKALAAGDLGRALKMSKIIKESATGSTRATMLAGAARMGTFAITSALVASAIQSFAASKIDKPNASKEFALTSGSILAGTLGTAVAGKYGLRVKSSGAVKKLFSLAKGIGKAK